MYVLRKIQACPVTLVRAASTSTESKRKLPGIVLIDAVRTPFATASTVYKDLLAVDLQRAAFKNLIERTAVPFEDIGHIVAGTVIQESRTSNIAREAALTAGFPNKIPCHTVTLACISSNMAVSSVVDQIATGKVEAGIAGGVEFLSDVPVRYNRTARTAMRGLNRAKNIQQKLRFGMTLAKNFMTPELPEVPAITEFTSGESMGHSCDRLASTFGVSRREQDEFALRSHTLAEKATKEGKLTDLVPYSVTNGKDQQTVSKDNTVRVSTIEKLSALKPVFIKPHGTITPGNASPFTDGASAALISTEEYAKRRGYKPKAFIRDIVFVAQDPKDELLLGPAYAIPRVLKQSGLKLQDIDVFELHEAFAGQVLANLNALGPGFFLQGKFGRLPMEKLNLWGGSLSLGHPFGATGIRLIAHAANRLNDENGRFALVAACAAGGHGVGMIIERYQPTDKQ
ncbi:hypothetical protein M3Y97_00596800 [Aphelenchoides bicaudatus]|nr:hypothetical protein M3Y97_00596800 [Aphelenchoides bicaudatus]